MAKFRVMLTYPDRQIREPLLGMMTKRFDVMPNIRRAKVTEDVGEIVVELDGPESELKAGIAFLQEHGVEVVPIEGDVVSP
jgi:ABC-type methionine transport system ATPase subunit